MWKQTLENVGETVAKSSTAIFNPSNSIQIFSLDQSYLLKRRNKITACFEEKLAEELHIRHNVGEVIEFLKTDQMTSSIHKMCLNWNMLGKLVLLQIMFGKSSLLSQFVEKFPIEMNGKTDSDIPLASKMILFQLIAFLKVFRLTDYLNLENQWPITLNKVARMSGSMRDYYMLSSLLRLRKADKQLMEYKILDGYYVPLVINLPGTDHIMPILLSTKQSREEGRFFDQTNDFISLLVLRQHFKDRNILVCEYNQERPEHIRDLAKELNFELKLASYE